MRLLVLLRVNERSELVVPAGVRVILCEERDDKAAGLALAGGCQDPT